MAIIKWEPFADVESFFEDFPTPSFKELGTDLAVDLYEEGGNVVAKMNVPGVDPEKINVTVEDNTLRVSGSHEEEKEEKKKHYYHKEIRKGSFERMVSLPQGVLKDKVSAEYKNGTLIVTLPKTNGGESSHKVAVHVKK